MRSILITYDISDPKRLRRVFQCLKARGEHLQFSVFLCALSNKGRTQLEIELDDLIHHTEDQVLFIDLGKVDGRAKGAIKALGKPYTHSNRHAIVV